ncbi:MAG: orotate phosphoribosyltransferase [Candidatus Woesearchaeota archaeon]
MEISKEVARAGLNIKAIKLRPDNPFIWASGFRMPIYNDNRMFLMYPEHRKTIIQGFLGIIEKESIQFDIVAGTSTAGIPHGMALANQLNKPFIYIRDKPKDHGLKNQIEGIDADKDLEGRPVLVIEDLMSTGGSSAKAVQAVRDANGNCNYIISIFDYGLDKASHAFQELDPECNVRSLLTYDVLLKVAKETGYLNESQVKLLEEWRSDPFNWGDKHGFPNVEK